MSNRKFEYKIQKDMPEEGTYAAIWTGILDKTVIYSNHYSPEFEAEIFCEYSPTDMKYILAYPGAASGANFYIQLPSADFQHSRVEAMIEDLLINNEIEKLVGSERLKEHKRKWAGENK